MEARAWKEGRAWELGGLVKLIGVATLFRIAELEDRQGCVLGVEAWGWVWGVGCLGCVGWGVVERRVCPLLHAFAIDKET